VRREEIGSSDGKSPIVIIVCPTYQIPCSKKGGKRLHYFNCLRKRLRKKGEEKRNFLGWEIRHRSRIHVHWEGKGGEGAARFLKCKGREKRGNEEPHLKRYLMYQK